MGGTSGGLYAIGLSGLSKGLIQAAKESKKEEATVEVWSRGLEVSGRASFIQLLFSADVIVRSHVTARAQHLISIHSSATSFANFD